MARPPRPQILPLVCKKHGVLTPEQHLLCRQKGRQPRYRCHLCKIVNQRNTYRKGGNKKPKKGEPGYEHELALSRARKRKAQIELPDRIVKEKLIRNIKIAREDITPELIEVQRAITLIRRERRKSFEQPT